MPDHSKQSAGEQGSARDRGSSFPGGQDELSRVLSELLDRAKHTHRHPIEVTDPEVLKAVESFKGTTQRLAKPGIRALPRESAWALPPLNERLTPGSGPGKY